MKNNNGKREREESADRMAQIERNMLKLEELHREIQIKSIERSAEQDKRMANSDERTARFEERMARFDERMAATDERWIEMWKYARELQKEHDERFKRIEQLLTNLCLYLPPALQKQVGFQQL